MSHFLSFWTEEKGIKWCEVEFHFYIKYFSVTDVDNMIKPILDSLVENGVLEDDKFVKTVIATKHKIKKGQEERIEIKIKKLDNKQVGE